MTTLHHKPTDLSMMSHIAIQPLWFAQLPAFQSTDGRLVRGCINMLMSAFRAMPAGVLPATPEGVATAAQLDVELVQANFTILIKGWKRMKDRIAFEPIVEMSRRLTQEYGEALQRLQDGALVAIQAPDLFNSELLPEQGRKLAEQLGGETARIADALSDTRVKRHLPEGAALTPDMREYLSARGFEQCLHDDVWELFYNFQRSQQKSSASWKSEFKTWILNQIRYGKLVPSTGEVPAVFQDAMPVKVVTPTARSHMNFSFARSGQSAGRGGDHAVGMSRAEQSESDAKNKLAAASHAVSVLRRSRATQGA